MAKSGQSMWGTVRAAAVGLSLGALAAFAAVADDDSDPNNTFLINMKDADMSAFIEDISTVTGYTFIVHPDVQGKVTVTSPVRLTRTQVFEIFLSTLRVHGFTAVQTKTGTFRIVPDASAAVDSGAVGAAGPLDDQFVTQVFQLDNIEAVEAARMLTPMVNQRGQVSANAANNVLVVVDYAGNIDRIADILASMDQDSSDTTTVSLTNVPAAEAARVVNALDEGLGRKSAGKVNAVALDTSNAVVLRGDAASVQRVRGLVENLDRSSAPSESLKVVYLKHANAAAVVPILESLAKTLRPGADESKIPFDEATNSIILAGDPNAIAALVRVVDELDVRRPQVLVEAIIVEISDDVARDLGVQFLLAGKENSTVPFAVTNFSRSAPNLLAATGALAIQEDDDDDGDSVKDGLTDIALASLLGIRGVGFGAGGETDDALFGFILTAVQDDLRSNILSTPSVMTLNNEPAKILVGQEIPITTGEALGSDNANPFRTIQRQDVGVQLEVRPQINDGDTIKLYLRQEVSSVFGPVSANLSELITNKREIETTVLADDGEIIVLGGLIEASEAESESKVPVLGDIPIAGRAFKTKGREKTTKNLVIFIRPTIVRNADDMREAAARSYQAISGQPTIAEPSEDSRFGDLLEQTLGRGQDE